MSTAAAAKKAGPTPSEAATTIEVLESVLTSPATRFAWLLGFITGLALVGEQEDSAGETESRGVVRPFLKN